LVANAFSVEKPAILASKEAGGKKMKRVQRQSTNVEDMPGILLMKSLNTLG